MAGRRPIRLRSVSVLSTIQVEDEATQRALEATAAAVQSLQASRSRDAIIVDLVVGTNKVRHGLGRAVTGYTLTPTVLDATFAHALVAAGNQRPELEIWIGVIGAAQPNARVEVW
jgi:hypothetical protein